jgi:DNA topoisomerase-2
MTGKFSDGMNMSSFSLPKFGSELNKTYLNKEKKSLISDLIKFGENINKQIKQITEIIDSTNPENLYLSEVDHALAKHPMYAGSKQLDTGKYHTVKLIDLPDGKRSLVYDGIRTLNSSSALFKMVDESITNIIDSFTRIKNKNCRKEFKIKITGDTLTFTNIGEGIPVHDVVVEGKTHPRPHVMLGILRSGTNLDENKERVTGGTNGIGGKLVNLFSNKYILDTYDGKTYFKQTWSNNLKLYSDRVIEQKSMPDVTLHSRKRFFVLIASSSR